MEGMIMRTVATTLFIASLALGSFMLYDNRTHAPVARMNGTADAAATSTSSGGIVLYVGDGCPHCEIVEKYLKDNGVAAKVAYRQKEVFHNQQDAAELVAHAKTCGLPTDSVGVPFLWDGATCYVGDEEVIDFFKEKTAQ